jgi:5-methylcytosine-specific restriction endonuclease McrA
MLGAQAYPQIEHYVSRKVNPDRVFEWKNLLPVCQICNTSKGHADHQGSLLKPDAEVGASQAGDSHASARGGDNQQEETL